MGALLCGVTRGPCGPVGVSTRKRRLGFLTALRSAPKSARTLRRSARAAICTPQFPVIPVERCGRPMAQQYIYQMQGLTKAFPGAPKKTFSDIWLSFYPDAKIGVVGVNGSGKSTLLKIMAGLDAEFNGEAKAADGIKRGYLSQEPHLDDQLNVWGNVVSQCEEKKILDRYNEIAAKLGEDYSDELMEE